MPRIKHLFLALFTALPLLVAAQGSFRMADGHFELDGKPFMVKAAELHYPRIPEPYWQHRIDMVKALGINAVCLYVFWNVHEPEPGRFDFDGQNNLRRFVEMCGDSGMKVILRPGPYVCAEWEMGGLPWWLLREPGMRLREADPRFMARVEAFEEAVAGQLAGLTDAEGGPIIMVQVENEYGSFGKDKPYVAAVRDIIRRNFGPETVLFQCDWSSNFLDNALPDLLWTLNFGSWADVDAEFEPLRRERPSTPLMCSEYWSGWFDKWGAPHETRPADDMVAGLRKMLADSISFSLYMTHGGTNWGHWAGANSPGYAPHVTSYDYDAPIDEVGNATPKYHQLRSLLASYLPDGASLPPVPAPVPVAEVRPFGFTSFAPLAANIPAPVAEGSDTLPSMESLGQGFGSMLFSTRLPEGAAPGAVLEVDEPRDFAQVFVDGALAGTLDRRLGQTRLTLPRAAAGSRLDILVEAMGRINFGRAIGDTKGISRAVRLDSVALPGWQVSLLPDSLAFYESMQFRPIGEAAADAAGRYPRGVYFATFEIEGNGQDGCGVPDTWLDMSGFGKGLVYVNGHALGRFWEIGPQQALYLPGCWLREGMNEVMVFDILGPRRLSVRGLDKPLNDILRPS